MIPDITRAGHTKTMRKPACPDLRISATQRFYYIIFSRKNQRTISIKTGLFYGVYLIKNHRQIKAGMMTVWTPAGKPRLLQESEERVQPVCNSLRRLLGKAVLLHAQIILAVGHETHLQYSGRHGTPVGTRLAVGFPYAPAADPCRGAIRIR